MVFHISLPFCLNRMRSYFGFVVILAIYFYTFCFHTIHLSIVVFLFILHWICQTTPNANVLSVLHWLWSEWKKSHFEPANGIEPSAMRRLLEKQPLQTLVFYRVRVSFRLLESFLFLHIFLSFLFSFVGIFSPLCIVRQLLCAYVSCLLAFFFLSSFPLTSCVHIHFLHDYLLRVRDVDVFIHRFCVYVVVSFPI